MIERRRLFVILNARTITVSTMLIVAVGILLSIWYYCMHATVNPPAQSPYHSVDMPASARYYYQTTWGIDNLILRVAASGNLVRFSYRVTNVQRANELGNKRAEPLLIDAKRKVALQIPVMEQVGPLWQTVGLENGKEYWMTFANKGSPVKAGDRVSIVIGNFHADGLLVE